MTDEEGEYVLDEKACVSIYRSGKKEQTFLTLSCDSVKGASGAQILSMSARHAAVSAFTPLSLCCSRLEDASSLATLRREFLSVNSCSKSISSWDRRSSLELRLWADGCLPGRQVKVSRNLSDTICSCCCPSSSSSSVV